MTKDERVTHLHALVNEVTKDVFDSTQVKVLMDKLEIPYSEDPIELLNNILLGIHKEGPQNEKLA